MPSFLVFTLYAPLQSWGAIAVGGKRDTWRFPSRSAVVGLLAASKGIERDNPLLVQLHKDLRLAVRADGRRHKTISDYHTIEAPSGKGRWLTRAHELAADVRGTILSDREYLCDACFTVAVWTTSSLIQLSDFVSSLREPRFTLYLGRKSCPIAIPLNPEVIESDTAASTLAQRRPPRDYLGRIILDQGELTEIVADYHALAGIEARELNYRRDVLLDSRRWQFAERQEILGSGIIP